MPTSSPNEDRLWLALAAVTVAGAVSTWRLWTYDGLELREMETGNFEDRAGSVVLSLHDTASERAFHRPGLDAAGRISVPPGTVVATPLADGASYRVSADGGVPNVVLGSAASGADRVLTAAYALEAGADGGGALVPWQIMAPWRADAARLGALGRACHVTPDSASLVLTRQGDDVAVKLGACVTTLRWPDAVAGADTVLVTLAGPSWSFVERADRPLVHERQIRPWLAIGLLAAAGVVPIGLGRVMGVVVAAFVVVASFIQPVGAALCLALAAGMALLVLAAQLAARVLGSRRGRRAAAALAVLAAGALLVVPRVIRDPGAAPHGPGCVLAGYSMAEGAGLMGREGVYEMLRGCPACEGATRRHAKSAETFHFVRDLVCDDDRVFVPGDRLVFVGAANDDLMFAGGKSRPARFASRLLFFGSDYFRRHPGMATLNRLVEAAGRDALEQRDEQRELIDTTLACARRRGVSVIYVHDFLAEDMAEGRSPERQELLRLRRAAVTAGGGVFVDLERAFGGEVGVAWFSDFIHLSNVGHHHAAELLCHALTAPRGP